MVLSAGSLGTPAILERSGIGAKGVLDGVGVKQCVELPGVGENYQGTRRSKRKAVSMIPTRPDHGADWTVDGPSSQITALCLLRTSPQTRQRRSMRFTAMTRAQSLVGPPALGDCGRVISYFSSLSCNRRIRKDRERALNAPVRKYTLSLSPFFPGWLVDHGNIRSLEVGIKWRPNPSELAELGPKFKEVWDSHYANAPDKPVLWMGLLSA